ncbi:MAG: SidA/IucD/PvdA family monooxygenase, partial [Verrucomicrobia bacterium]|nr:SidA/IucD/PvdA family monooxygenase [Verrucomicrobiota bacterium]
MASASSRGRSAVSTLRIRASSIPANFSKRPVLVVGGGQSAAELLNHLHTNTHHTVTGIVADYGLATKEGTAFVNESYNGRFIDRFHDMTPAMREWFVGQRRNMNYGVVDSALIEELYNNCYHGSNFE